MRYLNWKKRFQAAVIHFFITLIVAGIAAALIFRVWFPDAFASMVGGRKLFVLLVSCDMVLGPLISLVIFSSAKPRRELVTDYCVVGVLQLAALMYGIHVVSQSRPVFIAFTKDRYEIVTAAEIAPAVLAQASSKQYAKLSWLGPVMVGVQMPTESRERVEMVLSALDGKDVQLMPKYYRSYESQLGEVKQKAQPLQSLFLKCGDCARGVAEELKRRGVSESDVGWLPVHSRFGFWTALVNVNTGYPVKYLPIDPL